MMPAHIAFRRLNLLTGWCCWGTAAVLYLLTVEPAVSFWDCGEFITAANKLEVGHPPGAPLFLLLGRIFTLFAPDATKVALCVNIFSALASAFTVLFLFWTITHITRRIVEKQQPVSENSCPARVFVVLASGVIGSLAYAFSDTFWFSAVEGEVYAVSSLFTAVVFWAILRWETVADKPYAHRWLILIACLMGLSIGVHLLNLLTIPAIVLIYYFRKYPLTCKGVLLALLCAFIILATVLYGIIPGVVKAASYFELLFVNEWGFPYHSGVLCYCILLTAVLSAGLLLSYLRKSYLVHTILLAFAVILIGYSSYGMIVIRSLSDPPVDEGNPDNIFSLMSYLNREQYGDRPLLYGAVYNAPREGYASGHPVYTRQNGRYEITYRHAQPLYDARFYMLLPRMYSPVADHIKVYESWGNVEGRPVELTDDKGGKTTVYKPTFAENIRFFLTYQLGHMYGRYFMWNFSGRQNDIQADGGILYGNWISGIPFIDGLRLGTQKEAPEHMKNNAGRNAYFMLPLLLGLIGMWWHARRDGRYFWVVMTLFFMTGIAVVVYLNQTPLQPRERDYAYAGSFYAFAVWIGLGVAALYDMLRKKAPLLPAALVAVLLSAAAPALMVRQNYRDHDRSDGYTARDMALNYLQSCAPNAILFTSGDNDTFPLWYLQEVEGIRTDVRVVNLMLLRADWYISQMKSAACDSPPLPFRLPETKYLTGTREAIYLIESSKDTVRLQQALEFIDSDDPQTRFHPEPGIALDYYTGKNFSLHVNRQRILDGMPAENAEDIPEEIYFRIGSSVITKEQWIVLEIIAANEWKRPIYWTACNHSGTVGLDDYLQLDGTAYRLTPFKTDGSDEFLTGRIDSEILYDRLMNVFRWGRFERPDAWIDCQSVRSINVVRARHLYTRLALQLMEENRTDRAVEALEKALNLFPPDKLPYDYYSLFQAEALYLAGQTDKANGVLAGFVGQCMDELRYFYSLPPVFFESVERESKMNEALLAEIMRIATDNGQEHINQMIQNRLEKRQ
ncbi:MAG: DUF2723 domain-containing protein [Bacteroidales bacterium]|jgi:tetratricopeptide (TPR) repeat protein|nr:DUF2723 domain-containing protein [Bacteroidales bacterium]